MRFLLLILVLVIYSCNSTHEKELGLSTNDSDSAAIAIVDSSLSATPNSSNVDTPKLKSIGEITFHVFNNDTMKQAEASSGFGYDIMMNGRLYLHQPYIPAIQGLHSFKSEIDANKMAGFVINKIKNNIMPPSVSIKEIDSLGIKY